MTHLGKLAHHCVWANEMWIGFADAQCASDQFVVKRISHILLSERAWFQRVLGEEPDPDIWTPVTVAEQFEMNGRHRTLYENVLADSVDRVIAYKRFTGEEYASPVGDILLHLTLHGAHHRGQIATHVSGVGIQPINTDFIQFCLVHGL